MNVCLGCGYDLRGSDPKQCPECGSARPQGVIDLLVTTQERASLRRTLLFFVFAMYVLVAAPFLYFRGTPALVIALGLVSFLVATVLAMHLFGYMRRGSIGPDQQDAVRFTPSGVLCRQLGTWSSLMPYKELDGFVLRRRMFGTSWRFRVTFRLLGISFPFVRGRVNLDDQTAAHLRSEIPARIAQAKRSRQP